MLDKANIKCSIDSNASVWHSCLQGQFSKFPFQSNVDKTISPYHTIHSDLQGPSSCVLIDGYIYYVIFIDGYVQTQFSCSIKILQSVGEGEYVSKQIQSFFISKGIIHQKSCPYTTSKGCTEGDTSPPCTTSPLTQTLADQQVFQ